MTAFRPVVINSGVQSQLPNADSLLVGTGIDKSTAGTLTIGATTATAITIGSALVTTDFPGPVKLTGDVTTVGGTTFITDATFEGDVTFGNATSDKVTFISKVDSDINFAGGSPTYKITNLANGTNPNDAVNYSQLSAIVSGVSSVSASAPLDSSGGATPNISLTGVVSVANGGTNSSSFTAGSVIFAGAGGTSLTQDNSNLFWNDSNNRLGIGTATPACSLDILGSVGSGGDVSIQVKNSSASGFSALSLADGSGASTANARFQYMNTGWSPIGLIVANRAMLLSDTSATEGLAMAAFGGPLLFVQGGYTSTNERLRISSSEAVFNDVAQNIDFRVEGQTDANLIFADASADRVGIGLSTPNEKLSVNGRISLAEGSVPSNTAGYGKLWADSTAKTLHFYDNSVDYLVTPNTVQTITYAASVAVDFDPALPPLKTVTLTGDIAFTSSNLGASRNVSVRVIGDTVSRNLTSFPAGWKWLGGAVPTVLEANKTAILSLASFSTTDSNVIASWSYDGSVNVTQVTASSPLSSTGGTTPAISFPSWPANASGVLSNNGSGTLTWAATPPATLTVGSTAISSGTTNRVLFEGAGNLLQESANLTFDGSTLTTSNGASATDIFVAKDNTTAVLTVADGGAVTAQNSSNSVTAFQVQNAAGTTILGVNTTDQRVGVGGVAGASLTHTFNVGPNGSSNFCVASGGRIHTYDGTAPTDGQILIGDTALGNFAKATITAGTGVSVTNGAGTITLAATGTVPLTTTGLTAGDVCYASANSTGSAAIATAASTSRVLGFVNTVGASGTIKVTGIYASANFITGLTGLAAGQPVFLSKTSGKLTNDVSAFTTGDVVAEIGIAVSVSSATGGTGAADVLIQPKSIVVL